MQAPKAVICDLDGLLLDTESLCVEVAGQVLQRYGKKLTCAAHKAALGKRPLECWRDVAAILGLDVPAQKLFDDSEPLLRAKWPDTKLLPGARRMLLHLQAVGIPLALATSTSRATFNLKMEGHPWLPGIFQVVVCGDEVQNGKPAPDAFLAAAEKLGVPPGDCLVFEDAPSGVEGAVAAGMRVVMVPSFVLQEEDDSNSLPEPQRAAAAGVIAVLPSLLAWQPASVGLPPFTDLVAGVIPMAEPLYIKGPVVKGFGRGSKELGIPTANLGADSLRHSLAQAVTGIYCGWSSLGDNSKVYPMCMSIGWNPFYANKEKTAEPWILHEFDKPFYGEEIRLVVCGYVRPEANFTSLEALVTRIHQDADMSKEALGHQQLQVYAADPFLQPPEALKN